MPSWEFNPAWAFWSFLAGWLLVSGLDDLFLNLYRLWHACFRPAATPRPDHELLASKPPKRIAVLVPLWREYAVIGRMLRHNLAAIDYPAYDFFIGCYPNDPNTLAAVRNVADPRVHLAVCPHDGPTSKADCLNWAYQNLLLEEERRGEPFELILTHDAEDLIHRDAFWWMNWHADAYDMIQVPVLPLPTPWSDWVHGVYCDEFSEFQRRDMSVRSSMGSFVPSNGVGTAYTRRALQQLAAARQNCIFDPVSLTEDYENGLGIHELGLPQIFVSLQSRGTECMATREYFPRTLRTAIRQRTRWATGICLQTWERHGWRGRLAVKYWFWRDRKGLIGSPLSLVTNLLWLYGTACWWMGQPLTSPLPGWLTSMLVVNLGLQAVHLAARMLCVAPLYGWRFAVLAPLRVPVGNLINACATLGALWQYGSARLCGRPLRWLKTDHAYPTREGLVGHKRKLGQVLVASRAITQEDLEQALATKPPDLRLGEHLIRQGRLRESQLYAALAQQQALHWRDLSTRDVERYVARSLPLDVMKRWKLLPVGVKEGSLRVASPELPSDALHTTLRHHTSLPVEFQLVTPTNYEQLVESLW